MNAACAKWTEKTNIFFSIYGSPIESTTYKFAKCLQRRFGIIEGVTDKGYITNSYHVNVREEIDAFSKLKFEAQFQALSTGGAVSYVEVPNMQDNLEAVISVIQFIYDNIMYAELNTKSDYCQVCGYDGEIRRGGRGRQAGLGMPALRQPRSGSLERCPPDLRLHRHPVLEPRPHAGNQRESIAFVRYCEGGGFCARSPSLGAPSRRPVARAGVGTFLRKGWKHEA